MAQDTEGELIAYRSESLDEERKSAVLAALENNDLFTQAESRIKYSAALKAGRTENCSYNHPRG